MKTIFMVIVLCCLTTGGFSMIETMTCDELILNSDLIVIGRVLEISRADSSLQSDLPPEIEALANRIEIEENFSNSAKEVVVITIKGFEDDVSFEKGASYLLFLQKVNDNYIVFNSPQGALFIEPDQKLSGMINLGITLESARKKITQALKQYRKKP